MVGYYHKDLSGAIFLDDAIRLPVELGALRKVPVWEASKQGRNWAAVIELDPKSPGGLRRKFLANAKGDYYYLVDGVKPGDAIEFAADDFTSGGKRWPRRWYGAVADVLPDALVIAPCKGPREAVARAREIAGAAPDAAPDTDALLLMSYPDAALISELERRGYSVAKPAAG